MLSLYLRMLSMLIMMKYLTYLTYHDRAASGLAKTDRAVVYVPCRRDGGLSCMSPHLPPLGSLVRRDRQTQGERERHTRNKFRHDTTERALFSGIGELVAGICIFIYLFFFFGQSLGLSYQYVPCKVCKYVLTIDGAGVGFVYTHTHAHTHHHTSSHFIMKRL